VLDCIEGARLPVISIFSRFFTPKGRSSVMVR